MILVWGCTSSSICSLSSLHNHQSVVYLQTLLRFFWCAQRPSRYCYSRRSNNDRSKLHERPLHIPAPVVGFRRSFVESGDQWKNKGTHVYTPVYKICNMLCYVVCPIFISKFSSISIGLLKTWNLFRWIFVHEQNKSLSNSVCIAANFRPCSW